jgi:hypothetical protein
MSLKSVSATWTHRKTLHLCTAALSISLKKAPDLAGAKSRLMGAPLQPLPSRLTQATFGSKAQIAGSSTPAARLRIAIELAIDKVGQWPGTRLHAELQNPELLVRDG